MPERLSNRRQKEIRKLTRRKHRRRRGETLVEGRRAVETALAAGAPLRGVVVSEAAMKGNGGGAALAREAEDAGQHVFVTSAQAFEALSAVASPQGILAVARIELAPVEALAPLRAVLVLDGVQDPGNVGTALRTAGWFGAGGVIAGPGTAGLYGPKTLRAAMGAHWGLTLARAGDLAEALRTLRRAGFALYGADLVGTPASAWRPHAPSALILGSEAHGLSAAALDLAGERVALPATATAQGGERIAPESLNVAVAGGVLIYEWLG